MNPQTDRAEQLDPLGARRGLRRSGMHRSSIAGAVFLLGLGMLVLTGWWWPGIMLVIGLASAAELARRGQMLAAIGTFLGFAAIPVAIALVSAIGVPWLPVGAFIVIALGLLALARTMIAEEGAAQ